MLPLLRLVRRQHPRASNTLDIALAASGCDNATVLHKLRLLSDNGWSYIAGDPAEYLNGKGMTHVRGAPMHPQTQGKIERWHLRPKTRILLENDFPEGELEAAIAVFINPCNNHRIHESIGTPPGGRLLRPRTNNPDGAEAHQGADPPKPPLEPAAASDLT